MFARVTARNVGDPSLITYDMLVLILSMS